MIAARTTLTHQRKVPTYRYWWLQDSAGVSAFGVNATAYVKVFEKDSEIFSGTDVDGTIVLDNSDGKVTLNIDESEIETWPNLKKGWFVLVVNDPDKSEGWPVRMWEGPSFLTEEYAE